MRRHAPLGDETVDVLGDRPVRHRNALGPAGRARRVDDVGQMVGVQGAAPVGVGQRGVTEPLGVAFGGRQLQPPEHRPRAGVGDQVVDALLRVGGVDGQVGRAGFQHGQHRDEELDRCGHAQADDVVGTEPLPNQPARQSVCAAVQLGVGQPRLVGDERGRFGRGRCGRLQQRDHGGRRGRDEFAVRLRQDTGPLARAEHVDAGEPATGLGQRVVEQLQVVGQQLIDQCTAQLGLVFELDGHPVGVEHDGEREWQVRGHRGQVQLAHGDAVQREFVGGLAHREAQPDQAVHAVVPHPLGVDFAHDAVDADGLMREAVEAGFAHRAQERVEGVPLARGEPQQQRVAEVADGTRGGRSALGDRHRDQEIRCAGVAAHQHTKGRQQHHERRGGVLAGEFLYPGEQLGRHHPGAALGPPGRVRGGQAG